ncbi:MAG: SpoIID/LytB domain-containing protein, partial [Actinomycetota bacterium]|nr:SpoIID/LytB domain-containing protein [Actinomycetota bacterium]
MLLAAASSPALAALTRNDVLAKAKAGEDPKAIIAAAFPGGTLQQIAPKPIKVLIADQAPRVILSGQTPLILRDGGLRRAPNITVPAGHRIRIVRTKRAFRVDDLDKPGRVRMMVGPVQLDSGTADTGIRMAEPLDRRFRGTMRVYASDGRRMMVVNELSTENYIRGVLPGNMPPEWGNATPNALVVGAVAARSSALTARAASTKAVFHATSDDPLYLGLDGERGQTNMAIDGSPRWTVVMAKQPFEASFPVV